MHFEDLNLLPSLLAAVRAEGYSTPTPIQAQAIPHVLNGRDLLGCAQTGTGKTAAFALPMLQRMAASVGSAPRQGARPVRALILTPTRELATQIADSFAAYGRNLPLTGVVIFGGVGQDPQVRALREGVDILVATPGRLLDLMGQGLVSLRQLEIFVLDEADRMLDMGFLHDVKRVIAALPTERQTLFFSATMPPDIADLARSILRDPVRVEVTPVSSTAERIDQSVYMVETHDKRPLLEQLLRDPVIERVLVFTRTKHGANRVAEQLEKANIPAAAIHGNKSQNARTRALAGFKSGHMRVLVATDIAARGIDIEGITHVINYDLPNIPESYVHRIGRTARAGASGVAISFCAADERSFLRDIEKLIRLRVPVVNGHAYESHEAEQPPKPQGRTQPHPGRGGSSHRGSSPKPQPQNGRPAARSSDGPRAPQAARPAPTAPRGPQPARGPQPSGAGRPAPAAPARDAQGSRPQAPRDRHTPVAASADRPQLAPRPPVPAPHAPRPPSSR